MFFSFDRIEWPYHYSVISCGEKKTSVESDHFLGDECKENENKTSLTINGHSIPVSEDKKSQTNRQTDTSSAALPFNLLSINKNP